MAQICFIGSQFGEEFSRICIWQKALIVLCVLWVTFVFKQSLEFFAHFLNTFHIYRPNFHEKWPG